MAADNGRLAEGDDQTLGVFLDYWLGAKALQVTPGTLANLECKVRKYLKPRLGHVRLRHLRPAHVVDLYRSLEAEGRSTSVVRTVGQYLRQALRYGIRYGFLADSPAHKVPLPRQDPTRDSAGR
jgi:Phage integrase, N-terminal SAM-like domain